MKYSAVKGVHDIFQPDIYIWQYIEAQAKEVCSAYGFQELRAPIIESTAIFSRSIGEATDIVEKEMYTFPDRAGRSITLRPEGTAPVVRAYIENHLYTLPSPQKFYYSGPMFRYERPQKGRFRQFYQIGAEAFGLSSPELDVELLSILKTLFERIGLKELNFEINSIGCEGCRPLYRDALTAFFAGKLEALCPDCNRRYDNNPLRILDCKVERCIELRSGAPEARAFICNDCRTHFEEVLSGMKLLEIPYVINPGLVRGLDYYTRTVFEVTSEHLGSQKAVAAGGRYDRLVEEFGGPKTPAIGFAIGMERLTTLIKEKGGISAPVPDLFIAALGKKAVGAALLMSVRLRAKGLWVEIGYDGASLKSQLRKADRLSAAYVFIIGEDELLTGSLKWKDMKDGSQGEVAFDKVDEFTDRLLPRPSPR